MELFARKLTLCLDHFLRDEVPGPGSELDLSTLGTEETAAAAIMERLKG
jgi:hypothetical protein